VDVRSFDPISFELKCNMTFERSSAKKFKEMFDTTYNNPSCQASTNMFVSSKLEQLTAMAKSETV